MPEWLVQEYEYVPAVLNVRLASPDERFGTFEGAPVTDAKVTLWVAAPPSCAHFTLPPRVIDTDVGLNAKLI